ADGQGCSKEGESHLETSVVVDGRSDRETASCGPRERCKEGQPSREIYSLRVTRKVAPRGQSFEFRALRSGLDRRCPRRERRAGFAQRRKNDDSQPDDRGVVRALRELPRSASAGANASRRSDTNRRERGAAAGQVRRDPRASAESAAGIRGEAAPRQGRGRE